RRLDYLLGHPRVESFVVPLPEGEVDPEIEWHHVATKDGGDPCKDLRHTCYANVGGFIVRRCHALVALWNDDEPDPNRPSGTAESVKFKLQGRVPECYPKGYTEALGFRAERGLVLAVYTPRVSVAGAPGRAVGALTVLVPNEENERWRVPDAELPLPRR